jgi:signal transduction histidine kinase
MLNVLLKRILFLSCFVCFGSIVCAQNAINVIKWHTDFNSLIYTNLKNAKKVALQAVAQSEILKNDTLLLESYNDLSKWYWCASQADSSAFYTEKALIHALALKDVKKEAILLNRKGKLARMQNQFTLALTYHEKALKLSKLVKNDTLQVDVLSDLGILYRNKRDEKKGLHTIEEAITLAKTLSYHKGLADSYNTKGLLYRDTNKDSTEYYYNKAFSAAQISNNRFFQGIVLSNLGDHYVAVKANTKAINTLNKAKRIAEEVGDFKTLYYVQVSKSLYYENIGEYQKSVDIYKTILKKHKGVLNNSERHNIYWLLSGVLWDTKAYEEALEYQERYIYLNDTIFNLEKEKEFQDLRTQYEVEKKDHEIQALAQQNALERNRKRWIITTALLLILPLLALFLIYKQRVKTQKTIRAQEQKLYEKETERLQQEKKLKETQALIKGQDKERDRIAQELHDGIGGQLASINLNLTHINLKEKNSQLTATSQALKQTFKELRALSHDLSYNYHQDKTFTDLLAELQQKYQKYNTLQLNISIFPEGSLQQFQGYIKHNLYRVLQELLANVVKHAQTKNAELTFNTHAETLIVILEDQGKGFNASIKQAGIGLKNIKQRVASINGKLTIDSIPGKGTSVIIEMPIKTTLNGN